MLITYVAAICSLYVLIILWNRDLTSLDWYGSIWYCVDELVVLVVGLVRRCALSQEVILLAVLVFMLMLWMIPVLRLVDLVV
jgi:hypothetical protein